MNLFGGKELIKITEMTSSIDSKLKGGLLETLYHFPIFIADELPVSSTTRKFFESEESLVAIGCYPDDELGIIRLASQKIRAANKNIQQEALKYFAQSVYGDRLLFNNELEKLLFYTHNKNLITLDDVEEVVNASIAPSPDKMCASFASKDAYGYFMKLEKLMLENISPVWIIRAMIRYYINLYIVLSKKSRGVPLEVAITSLRPAIFFKNIDSFKKNVSQNSIDQIVKALRVFQRAEIDAKSAIRKDKEICELLFFEVYD
jgi:DNA polymerase-3 subunit delta